MPTAPNHPPSSPTPLIPNDTHAPLQEGAGRFVTTEYEPVFDAAEFTRMGRDIFVQRYEGDRLLLRWLSGEHAHVLVVFTQKSTRPTYLTVVPEKVWVIADARYGRAHKKKKDVAHQVIRSGSVSFWWILGIYIEPRAPRPPH